MTDTAYTTITLPADLAARIKRRIDGTGFTSLSSYVTFVLREALGQEPRDGSLEFPPVTQAEKAEVVKRLKNLGYI